MNQVQIGGLTFQHNENGIYVLDPTGRPLLVANTVELLLRAREALKVAEARRAAK